MTNPVLVEVTRSGFVESVHRGAVVVLDPDGRPILSAGDVTSPIYPRSSSKPLQALAMLRHGLGLDGEGLALACASHSGEPRHVRGVLSLLERYGLGEDDLRCPKALPRHQPSMLAAPSPRRVAMNCSGKHTAMLVTCVEAGWDRPGYLDPEHELQRAIKATLGEATGEPIGRTGVDGCGAPLFAYSLTGLARAFGRLVTGDAQCTRIAGTMRAHPWLVAGTGREDTALMRGVGGLLSKEGAEGVHAVALADGTSIALKIDDGAARARMPVIVAVLDRLGALPSDPAAAAVLTGLARGPVLGGGLPVGEFRVPGALLG
ncbi:asparaginase [Amycolatopsis minnesotensis]|uniref:Asparaginase n=1 Tax=Amycolatopsis minnesotensis TaxID=337894 RepID=A0ABP5DR12_9PSEU